MAKDMASVGADSVLVATPCFYKSGMTREALEMHYTKVIYKYTCINIQFSKYVINYK